jgi:hypothetical protein
MLETYLKEVQMTRLPFLPNKKLGDIAIDAEKYKYPLNYRKALPNTIRLKRGEKKKPMFEILDENDMNARFMPDRNYRYINKKEKKEMAGTSYD